MVTSKNPFELAGLVLEKMNPGIFLTTKYKDQLNTMIIGWGGVQVIWGRPIFIVLVRDSRETYHLLENSMEFTISVPSKADLRKEIGICGTQSGRDINKFEVCHFDPVPGRKIETPVIKQASLHYECKVIYKQTLDQNVVPQNVIDRYYSSEKNKANHTVYYGEIVDCYWID